jgi:predicted short-subunit dehydrogenase-like oxidoreductase (DUF2520 family)
LNTIDRHAVVGPGRLGSTLLAALADAGIPVAAVGARSAARPQARPPILAPRDAAAAADVWWLAVPDDQIAVLAAELADVVPGRRVLAIHCSGLGSVSLLDPLARAGADVLSLHPLQSFGDRAGADLLRDVPCAVTAREAGTRRAGRRLAARLGMRPFDLEDERKPLYHLAAVVACNLFVALESEAVRLLQDATGRDDAVQMLDPILQTTLANLSARGPERALTGPVARGDLATVRAHLELLDAEPGRVAQAYRALSLQALTLAAPRLDDEMVRTLRELLEDGGR